MAALKLLLLASAVFSAFADFEPICNVHQSADLSTIQSGCDQSGDRAFYPWQRVACVGDSTTLGQEVGPGLNYPEVLSNQLNARIPGGFQVWNLGMVGSRTTTFLDSPPGQVLLSGTWDAVVIYLGTNDGRASSNEGSWMQYCSGERSSWCPFDQGMYHVIDTMGTLGRDGVPPRVFTIIPNPAIGDNEWGESEVNQNERLPVLIPKIAMSTKTHTVDMFSVFGGNPNWRAGMPPGGANGCTTAFPLCNLYCGDRGIPGEPFYCMNVHPNPAGYNMVATNVANAVLSGVQYV